MIQRTASTHLQLRIDTAVADLIPALCNRHELDPPRLIEKLILEEAKEHRLVPTGDAGRALASLLASVEDLLNKHDYLAQDPDVTLTVFNEIKATPRLMRQYEAAISPPKGVRPEKRRQFVHQRVGRFIKDYLGLVSVEERTLPRGSDALIRGYTRLAKP
jgi:hypothetical protein